MSNATATPQLQGCYSVIVYTQHLVMVNSSCFSCCHWNGTIKSKLPTNCFRAKLYSVSNHGLLLPSEPHTVRLLVKSDILKLSGSPQNLLQQMTVCDNIISVRVYFRYLLLWPLLIVWIKMFMNHISSSQLAMWCNLRCYSSENNFAIDFIENNSGWCNLSPCWCIDTQSYGEKAIYPKHACYRSFVYNFIF